MSASTVRHPIFARFFDRLSRLMEREAGRHRDELLAGLDGRIVEVGAGNGINFAHYPGSVTEVIAREPEAYLRQKAQRAARDAPVPVNVRAGVAAALPFEDASVDGAVASLVLCTVPDLPATLPELRRVLKPCRTCPRRWPNCAECSSRGGELRFMEHVRSEHSRTARLQQRLDRSGIWPRLGGGCHCGRDTVTAIKSSGFQVNRVRRYALGPSWIVTNPHVLGSARAPETPTSE